MESKGFTIKMSPVAWRFFKNDAVQRKTRLELLKRCLALKDNPYPEGHKTHIIKGEKIYRLVDVGARICYTVENTTVTILVVLVNV